MYEYSQSKQLTTYAPLKIIFCCFLILFCFVTEDLDHKSDQWNSSVHVLLEFPVPTLEIRKS